MNIVQGLPGSTLGLPGSTLAVLGLGARGFWLDTERDESSGLRTGGMVFSCADGMLVWVNHSNSPKLRPSLAKMMKN